MKKIKLLLIILTVIVICWLLFKEKGFYEYSKNGDYYRIPMIEPIEIRSYDYGNNWFYRFQFHSIKSQFDITNISSIGIKDSLVFLYRGGWKETWVIVDINNSNEILFTAEESFNKYLQKSKINEVKLYDVKSVFKEFDITGNLPNEWPCNKKNKIDSKLEVK